MSQLEYQFLKKYGQQTLNIGDIDNSKLEKIIENDGVYDHVFQENLTKIFNSLSTASFKRWIENIKVIGTPSANGIAMEGKTREGNRLFVLKVSRKNDKKSVDDMVHEA